MRKLMLLVAAMLVALSLAVSPALADDEDFDGFDDETGFAVEVEYVCWIDDIDWDGDGFGDEFGLEVEYECEVEDVEFDD